MDFCKVIFRRAITQYRSCRRTNCTQKIFNSNINTNPCINCNYPNKLSSICGQKFPNYDFTENYHSHDFTNGYFKKFHSDNAKSSRTSALKKLIVGGVLVGSVTYLINKNRETVSTPIGEYSSEYPDFTPEQVAKHKTRTTGIWVTYNKGVYDVTDLINKDPEGTDHYLISAGGPVYSFSTANNQPDEETCKVLENYRIDPKVPVGEYKSGLPEYTMEQVAQHETRETKVWMSYKQGIYDVTDYIKQHPGGEDNVMMAAGGPLEPYWSIYTQHHVDSVFGLLEKYRIGNLKPSVTPKNVCFVADIPGNPFEHEPQRDSRMIPITERPFNGGVKGATLTQSFITPNEIFYVRNHLPVPYLKEEEYKLTVEVEGVGSKTFTLDDLKKLPQVTRMLSLQCGGLRRQEMTDLLKKDTQGVKWEINGVSNAVWTGVLLIDVMKAAGFKESMEELEHLQFTSGMSAGGPYVTGIPIYRVLNPKNNIMLAWEMNGKKLHPDHGLPLRVVVPGLIGAKSVKQIEKIEVRKQECQAHWHQQLYKYFGPYVTLDNVDYSSQPPVTELPVMSAILSPADKDTVSQSGGTIPIKGFAYSGGGCKIVRVDVSANRGKTWMPAKITDNAKDPAPYHFTWSLWQVDVPTNGKKCVDVWVKAVDSSGNTQPEFWEHIYNIRGVACTAYHKIRVNVK